MYVCVLGCGFDELSFFDGCIVVYAGVCVNVVSPMRHTYLYAYTSTYVL